MKEARKPRKGELNFELEKMIRSVVDDDLPFSYAMELIQLRTRRIARKFGIDEFKIDYDHSCDIKSPRAWINDGITILMFRRRPNGSMAIHRAGCARSPVPQKKNPTLANLYVKRELRIFSFVDERYAWEKFTVLKPRKSLVKQWKAREARSSR